ncbi:Glycosyl hydrolases family 32 N-terminal domain-containing protein, partial [Azotobacter beijerinckii]
GARQGDDPLLLLYRSRDLRQWECLGRALEGRQEADGYMWECPDLFELEGRDVFLFSPQGLEPDGYERWNLFQNSYRLGRLDESAHFVAETELRELDHGHDFYAAQTLSDPHKITRAPALAGGLPAAGPTPVPAASLGKCLPHKCVRTPVPAATATARACP